MIFTIATLLCLFDTQFSIITRHVRYFNLELQMSMLFNKLSQTHLLTTNLYGKLTLHISYKELLIVVTLQLMYEPLFIKHKHSFFITSIFSIKTYNPPLILSFRFNRVVAIFYIFSLPLACLLNMLPSNSCHCEIDCTQRKKRCHRNSHVSNMFGRFIKVLVGSTPVFIDVPVLLESFL